MAHRLSPRGPDGTCAERISPECIFGHSRLAIVDTSSAGAQPFTDNSKRFSAIVNGEIYNHRTLRAELENHGHQFRSRCDSEVVVHGYAQWGDEVVRRLQGIFALAVYDAEKDRLLLARDAAGVKPLYFAHMTEGLAFASELKALRAVPSLATEFDPDSIRTFLAYRYLPAPITPYRNVRKLEPGHLLVFERGRHRVTRYWHPVPRSAESASPRALRECLQEVVTSQLMADVPMAVLLSGGIDSSAVAALAAKGGSHRLPAYCCGFEEASHDERPFARLSAATLSRQLYETVMDWPALLAELPSFVEWFDEPFFDYSAVAIHRLSRMARANGAKVLLAGDGADELFAGYLWYDRLNGIPAPNPDDMLEHYFGMLGYFTQEGLSRLAGTPVDFDHLWRLRQVDRPELPAVSRAQWLDFHTFLPDDILAKVDRASMAAGVEVRVPFLDQRLLDNWFLLPQTTLYAHGERKALLKQALRGVVPDAVLTARKKGFGFPLDHWERSIRAFAEPLLRKGALIEFGFASPAGMQETLGRPGIQLVWLLLTAELWLRRFMRGESVADLVAGHTRCAAG